MSSFIITLSAVATMLCYGIPGFWLVRSKRINKNAIQAFATVLMYVCSPCLNIYTIVNTDFSKKIVIDIIFVFFVALIVQTAIVLCFKFLFRKKFEDVNYRIYTIATAMGNCGFMGVPLLEAIIPEHPEAIVMSTVFCISMSLLGWTLISSIISNDKSYISLKKAILNPSIISVMIAIPIFVAGIKMPHNLNLVVTLLGKMSAPMCMLIMGMRLATMDLKSVFTDIGVYGIVVVKQFGMPLLILGIMLLLPVDAYLVKTMYILSATPIASMVLNYSELIGEGQEKAANLVLVGTLFSVITLPLMMLLAYH